MLQDDGIAWRDSGHPEVKLVRGTTIMMTDPIADMLTRIRNAGTAGHKWVDMPVSKLKAEVARILKENHFVYDFKLLDDGRFGVGSP